MTSDSVSRRSALRTGAGAVAAGVTIVALPAAAASASEGGSSGSGYGGYTAQQIANFVTVNFSNTGGNRSLGFNWQTTSPTANVGYTSSVSGPFTGSPSSGSASGGTVPPTNLPGWDDSELVSVTLSATGSPFTATVTFDVDANGNTTNWRVDGQPVNNPYFGGYSSQEVVDAVGITTVYFNATNRQLGFLWYLTDKDDPSTETPVQFSSVVSGPFTNTPLLGTAVDGAIGSARLFGWDSGETVNVTLNATSPINAQVTFTITATSTTFANSTWAINGESVART